MLVVLFGVVKGKTVGPRFDGRGSVMYPVTLCYGTRHGKAKESMWLPTPNGVADYCQLRVSTGDADKKNRIPDLGRRKVLCEALSYKLYEVEIVVEGIFALCQYRRALWNSVDLR